MIRANNMTVPVLPVGVPPGSVMAFAGKIAAQVSSPPQQFETLIEKWGWMVCDGRQLSIEQYPVLFQMIGFIYAQSGDDVSLPIKSSEAGSRTFRIPDYQGYFLRMVDPNGKVDKDNDDRKMPNGDDGAGVGSIQQDAMQVHQHQYSAAIGATLGKSGSDFAVKQTELTSTPTNDKVKIPGDVRVSQNETRAVNMAVYYIIKFT